MNHTKKWAVKLGMTAMLIPAVLNIDTNSVNAMAPSNADLQPKVEVKAEVAPVKSNINYTNKKVTVTAYMLNIRQSDSFSSRIVDVATNGQEYNVIRESNGLYQIGENQWISANSKYVTEGTGKASVTKAVTTKAVNNTNAVTTKTVAPKKEQPKETTTVSQSSSGVVNTAKQYLGVPYKWAGSSPSGFDCSGFIDYVYSTNGYNISRMSVKGYWGMATKISSPQPGDLVFFQNTYTSGPSHMGIYIGGNQMIHAGSDGIEVANLSVSYWKNHFLGYGKF